MRLGFLRGRTRSATSLIVAYIDEHVGARHVDAGGPGLRWGVESICAALTELGAKIAPATHYEHRGRRPTKRELRDAELKATIAAVSNPQISQSSGHDFAENMNSPQLNPAP